MKGKALTTILLLGLMGLILMACGAEPPIDVAAVTSQPKAYVGADTCKMCHLEHYDSTKALGWEVTAATSMGCSAPQANKIQLISPSNKMVVSALPFIFFPPWFIETKIVFGKLIEFST